MSASIENWILSGLSVAPEDRAAAGLAPGEYSVLQPERAVQFWSSVRKHAPRLRDARPIDAPSREEDSWCKPFGAEVRLCLDTEVSKDPLSVLDLMAESIARDLQELFSDGDIDSEDPFLASLDGAIKRKRQELFVPRVVYSPVVRVKTEGVEEDGEKLMCVIFRVRLGYRGEPVTQEEDETCPS